MNRFDGFLQAAREVGSTDNRRVRGRLDIELEDASGQGLITMEEYRSCLAVLIEWDSRSTADRAALAFFAMSVRTSRQG